MDVNKDVNAGVNGTKNTRKVITLERKLEIIKRYEAGEKKSILARCFGMNESTIRTIIRQSDSYKRKASNSYNLSIRCTRHRSDKMVDMERLLLKWIEECQANDVTLTANLIKKKALSLYASLGENTNENREFLGSSGWYERFKKRAGLGMIKNDLKAEYINEYDPRLCFNCIEVGLYWKRLPFTLHYTKNKHGYNPNHERISVLLCWNTQGDLKLKPLVIHRTRHPKALRGYNLETLPVVWRHCEKTASTNAAIFMDWLNNHFSEEVKSYCNLNNLDFNVLLTLNDTFHDDFTLNANYCVKINKHNISCNVMDDFRLYYIKLLLQRVDLGKFSEYNIKTGIELIKEAWDCLQLDQSANELVVEIVVQCHELNYKEVDDIAVLECLESSQDDSADLDQRVYEMDDEEDDEEMDLNQFQCMFATVDDLKRQIGEFDPNVDRSLQVRKLIDGALSCYKDLYEKRRKRKKLSVAQQDELNEEIRSGSPANDIADFLKVEVKVENVNC